MVSNHDFVFSPPTVNQNAKCVMLSVQNRRSQLIQCVMALISVILLWCDLGHTVISGVCLLHTHEGFEQNSNIKCYIVIHVDGSSQHNSQKIF